MLFQPPVPTLPDTIRLIHGDAHEAIAAGEGAALVIADPPWSEYDQEPGVSDPNRSYPTATLDTIAGHLGALRCTHARLLVWWCWPMLMQAIAEGGTWDGVLRPPGWRPVSGGAWAKSPHVGVGFHWLGQSEPALLYVRGRPATRRDRVAGNSWVSEPGGHSAKPEGWHEALIQRWTEPGDLVLDLYAGLGGVARACHRTGRRYVGAELDAERHAQAVGLTAHGGRIA